MSTQFLNIVRFPVPLEFKNEALGLRREIIVGSLVGEIYLPTENIGKISEPFSELRPPYVPGIDWAIKVFNHGGDAHQHLDWGKYFTWNPAVASVRHAAVGFNAAQANSRKSLSEVAAECHKHLPEWHTRLKEWIEVLTKNDLDADHPLRSVQAQEFVSIPWTFIEDGKSQYEYKNPMLVLQGSRGEKGLDSKLWSSAIKGANQGLHPSEVRILLRDARAALLRKNHRRTVLDAATATELLIGPALRHELLRTNTPKVVEFLFKQGWRFTWMKDFMNQIGMWLPKEVDKKLMNVRNAVIHKNTTITAEEARQALDLAEQLADHYQPLKMP